MGSWGTKRLARIACDRDGAASLGRRATGLGDRMRSFFDQTDRTSHHGRATREWVMVARKFFLLIILFSSRYKDRD